MGGKEPLDGARKWGGVGPHERGVQWGPNMSPAGPSIGPHLDTLMLLLQLLLLILVFCIHNRKITVHQLRGSSGSHVCSNGSQAWASDIGRDLEA